MKCEAKRMMSIIFLETSNIEWGQIDPKSNRRVTKIFVIFVSVFYFECDIFLH